MGFAHDRAALGLVWFGSELDVNREVNNGRRPVDFKASRGEIDKSLIEFKLGSNTQLTRNLKNQVEIYKKANRTPHAVKVIVCSAAQQRKVDKVLKGVGADRGRERDRDRRT